MVQFILDKIQKGLTVQELFSSREQLQACSTDWCAFINRDGFLLIRENNNEFEVKLFFDWKGMKYEDGYLTIIFSYEENVAVQFINLF